MTLFIGQLIAIKAAFLALGSKDHSPGRCEIGCLVLPINDVALTW